MCVLAHLFEAAGIATVALASMRPVAEKVAPPRALHGEFPLGRPLGRPLDPDFQHDVLARAFALLDADEGPVLESHPEVIEETTEAVVCPLPAAYDGDASPAVLEARGIRRAYERTLDRRGVTSVGRVIDADGVPAGLEALQRIVDGTPFREAGLPGRNTIALCHDIRTYYEEAALELVDGPVPGGRAVEAWFFEQTAAGALVLEARTALQAQDAPFPIWFYMAPGHR
ncbi:MAG: hypothetical protein GWN73_15810 [Actinobacteria bacterium]|nr:hypothetical protein [Actinomycetota bacterium]NIU66802.1 hypothetical protein [Actinomycetota bacterium]NIW28607.1 hypothetical protein [Actinomycetota bacterium]